MTLTFGLAIGFAILGVVLLIGSVGGGTDIASSPCDRCGVEGGLRWVKGEVIDGHIEKRSLCSECNKTVFLYRYRETRRWVSW